MMLLPVKKNILPTKLKLFYRNIFINQLFTNTVYQDIKLIIGIKKQKEQSQNIIIFQTSNHTAANAFAGLNDFLPVPSANAPRQSIAFGHSAYSFLAVR